MKRRTVVAFLGALALGSGAMLRRAVAALGQPAATPTMAAVADTMFPGGDGLPAASALGLHERLLAMSDLGPSIGKGVAWLDRYAASRGAAGFAALDEAARLAAIDAAFASADEGIRPFVFALRQHIGTAYYSEPAIRKTFAFTGPPQPDGFADFQERPR
ncbi:gluconate 2-dehydrogenase subunit 3 family protein [Bradyrhizobium sp.]|uniref:gluconate 2-dehydrogenase subunit 3 family protein n=1 Tax=Bradyrhizobium sp. TaxID=376 RepID=UPI001DB0AF4F|nr:gluconate 2-dehydrogenase subunit 3 family protein [Bradyrhizobium sp.]MBI5319626.1 gluconate 2-dehydrogenase subunit 3 family protein [Bradyrhizobium sp.]